MNKGLLRDGMIVQLRNEMYYIVIGKYLIGYMSHFGIDSYNDDLLFNTELQRNTLQMQDTIDTLHKWDIVKVWILRDMSNLHSMLEDMSDPWVNRFGKLIYDRERTNAETIEMTMEEVCNTLGKNVKIVE